MSNFVTFLPPTEFGNFNNQPNRKDILAEVKKAFANKVYGKGTQHLTTQDDDWREMIHKKTCWCYFRLRARYCQISAMQPHWQKSRRFFCIDFDKVCICSASNPAPIDVFESDKQRLLDPDNLDSQVGFCVDFKVEFSYPCCDPCYTMDDFIGMGLLNHMCTCGPDPYTSVEDAFGTGAPWPANWLMCYTNTLSDDPGAQWDDFTGGHTGPWRTFMNLDEDSAEYIVNGLINAGCDGMDCCPQPPRL